MADIKEVQLDSVNLAIIISVIDQDGNIVDVSSASTKNILIKKPDRTVLTKTGVFVTDGTDGKIQHLTIAGDLDQLGIYEAQGDIVVGSTDIPTVVSKFKVVRNIVCN